MSGHWIPMKQWRMEEAEMAGVQDASIANRLARGKYPGLKIKHINSRVVFVYVNDHTQTKTLHR